MVFYTDKGLDAMRYFSLTFKNIGKFIRFHPVMFLFLIFAQIVCCIAVFISCGMAYNMNYVEKKENWYKVFALSYETLGSYQFEYQTEDDGGINGHYTLIDNKKYDSDQTVLFSGAKPFREFKEDLLEFLDRTKDYDVTSAGLELYQGKEIINKNLAAPVWYSSYPGLKAEEVFDTDFMDSSDMVFKAPIFSEDGERNYNCPFEVGKYYPINNITYLCAGNDQAYVMPYKSIPDDFAVGLVRIAYKKTLTADEINSIVDTANSIWGTELDHLTSPEPYEPVDLNLSEMLFIISMAVILIVVFAISKLYGFILETRQRTLGVLRLCGARRYQVGIVYICEIMLTLLATTGGAFLLFRFVLFDMIAGLYPSFREFYYPIVYAAVIGAYLAAAMVIMTITVIPAVRSDIDTR